jgi:hypothetical protein
VVTDGRMGSIHMMVDVRLLRFLRFLHLGFLYLARRLEACLFISPATELNRRPSDSRSTKPSAAGHRRTLLVTCRNISLMLLDSQCRLPALLLQSGE